jgi:hypothetical protein
MTSSAVGQEAEHLLNYISGIAVQAGSAGVDCLDLARHIAWLYDNAQRGKPGIARQCHGSSGAALSPLAMQGAGHNFM